MTTLWPVKLKQLGVDWLPGVMLLSTIAGIGVSAYLLWGYTVPGAKLACGVTGGCETVKNSVYASLMGIPLPVFGFIAYLVVLGLLILQILFMLQNRPQVPYLALATFGLALTGLLFSGYLTYLELFVIYAICQWCVVSAIIMVILFLLSIVNLRQNI